MDSFFTFIDEIIHTMVKNKMPLKKQQNYYSNDIVQSNIKKAKTN